MSISLLGTLGCDVTKGGGGGGQNLTPLFSMAWGLGVFFDCSVEHSEAF